MRNVLPEDEELGIICEGAAVECASICLITNSKKQSNNQLMNGNIKGEPVVEDWEEVRPSENFTDINQLSWYV